jgi:hypothetical protein
MVTINPLDHLIQNAGTARSMRSSLGFEEIWVGDEALKEEWSLDKAKAPRQTKSKLPRNSAPSAQSSLTTTIVIRHHEYSGASQHGREA